MSNLYEFANRFRLIDVNGVFLENAGDYILIREPDKFKDTTIKLERDEKTHGVNYEYSDAETPFGFDRVKYPNEEYSGYDLVKSIFAPSR